MSRDYADVSANTAEYLLDVDLLNHAAKVSAQGPGLQYTGECLNCGEPLDRPHRFCPGGECRDDYEARESAKRRGGG